MRRLTIIVGVLVALVLGASLVGGAVAGAAAGHDDRAAGPSSPVDQLPSVTAATSHDADNDTLHEHPDEATGDGDLADLGDWFGHELGSMLGESSVQLSEEEYELARSLVGDRYDERLGQYVEIEDETGRDRDSEATRVLEQAAEDQRSFATAVEEFEKTYEAYEEAQADGDDERARELARELDAIADRANESGTNLTALFDAISEHTPADMDEVSERTEQLRSSIVERQLEIRGETFVETELTAEAASPTISTLDPLVVAGQLTTVDGEPIANGTIVLQLDAETATTTTNETGAFAIEHRPTVEALDTDHATLRYEPAPASEYLGSEATVDVELEQVAATLELTSVTDEARFGDEVVVRGTVSAGEVGPGGVPVAVDLGGERLGTVRTADDGTFALETSLPAAIPADEAILRASLPLDGQALSSDEATATVTVTETPTTLAVAGTQGDGTELAVEGMLETDDGTGVADQRIVLYVDDRRVGTATTASDGSYTSTVDVGSVLEAETDSVELEAVYADDGTNLGDASAATTVPVTPPGLAQSIVDEGWLPLAVAVGVLGAVLGVLAFGYRRRGWFRDADEGSMSDPSRTPAPTPVSSDESRPAQPAPLAAARERSAAGEFDRATELAYAAVRGRLGRHLTNGAAATHWEFFVQCTDADLPADPDALRTLTERYERAAFAPIPLTAAEATAAIDAAGRLVDGG